MDFWSRIVRGGTPKKSPVTSNSPQLRLTHFKRAYNSLLQIWNNGDIISTDAFVSEQARICLRRIAELLNTDQRGPTPHLCISFAATSRLLVTVARVSAEFNHDGITHEALGICSLLIDSEEEAFLEDRAFADILPEFIESIQRSVRQLDDSDTENSMVEVLFGIASKLRLEPHVLRVWFRPEKPEEDDEELSDSERRTQFEEFPLFYLLLHYVPAEGRAGEFARMGLLYIIESTSHSEDLEKWIVDGDMSALMASGLGALYSQLSRKLALTYAKKEIPTILTYSARLKEQPGHDAEATTSPEYQAHLATFLSSLVFWQDLLEHCASADVKQTLLDHFQYLFLQQLLYPSLLESSDVDGGSSVAVLTYLRHILESIDHPDLVGLTLKYLFGQQSSNTESEADIKPITKARRRKSDFLIARLAAEEEQFSPDVFSLADLIMSSLRSHSQQTVTVTLHLFSTLLRRPHHQAIPSLLKTKPAHAKEERRTVGAQGKEVDRLLNLAENLTSFSDLETSYDKHLHDNRSSLETHPCSIQLLHLQASAKKREVESDSEGRDLHPRLLMVEDPILKSLVALLGRFFSNDIETNLGLTQVIVDLASCGYMCLEGWLLTHPSKYQFKERPKGEEGGAESVSLDDREAERAQLHSIMLARREPAWNSEDVSPVHAALNQLLLEVEAFQRDIADFDSHLLDCRSTIDGDDVEHNALATPNLLKSSSALAGSYTPTRRPLEGSGRTSPTRAVPIPQLSSITERLKSDRAFGGDTTSPSPRGRQLDMPSTPTLVGRLTHLQVSPTRSASESSRGYSPSPLRGKQSIPSTPPNINRRLGKPSSALQRRIQIASIDPDDSEAHHGDSDSDASSLRSDSAGAGDKIGGRGEVSLGHLMTNVIILQEFILELAALVEVRASLFGEVRYL